LPVDRFRTIAARLPPRILWSAARPAASSPLQSRYALSSKYRGHLRLPGELTMRKTSPSLLLGSIVPALLLGGVMAGAQSQAQAPAAGPMRWSDPATWPNRKVPADGDQVIIARDKEVILDDNPPPLGGLSIDGKLIFSDDSDLELTT